jgi:hydroxypyruvate reductase
MAIHRGRSQRQLRADAPRIWSAALRAVDPEVAVRKHVRRRGNVLKIEGRLYDLGKIDRIWVLGAGKAAAPMGRALERTLGRRLAGGILVTKYGHGLPLDKLELLEAGHPLPDANGVAAGLRIQKLASEEIGPHDLVFCLLSGGGSALLVAPAPGISLADKLACTKSLLRSGATIHELNTIRKHLSSLKGGGLARILSKTPAISLILSDVVGDELDTIASGPLVPDPTTFQDCREIVRKFGLGSGLPSSIRRRLAAGIAGSIPETPKPGDPSFSGKHNLLVGNASLACAAAARAARRLGYRPLVLTSRLEGDTAESALFHMSIAREIVSEGRPVRRPACLLSGGETTVKVTGQGQGGRNQEFALQCVRPLARIPAPCLAASLGTDGTDGPTDAAGAIADNSTMSRSLKFGANFLAESLTDNDSYHFFQRLEDLIVTGPTRTNVMDLHIILIG